MADQRTAQTRARILLAASQVTLEGGVGQLTLEAVAAKANISKGGLLYHFASKEALVKGMIAYFLDSFDRRLEEHLARGKDWLAAYIDASLEGDPLEDQMSVSLLAAVVLNPELLEPLRARYAYWQEMLDASTGGSIQPTTVRLMIDGLWISNLLGLAPLSETKLAALRQYLAALTGGQS